MQAASAGGLKEAACPRPARGLPAACPRSARGLPAVCTACLPACTAHAFTPATLPLRVRARAGLVVAAPPLANCASRGKVAIDREQFDLSACAGGQEHAA